MVVVSVGDVAPGFDLESVNMGRVSLKDYSGRRVVLIFSRYFGCPVCQLDFDEILKHSDEIKEYAELIYFNQSSPESARDYLKDHDVDFPVIPVPSGNGYKVYSDYGVGNMSIGTAVAVLRRAGAARKAGKVHGVYEGRETQSPADFVVDESGTIIWAHRGVLKIDALLGFLESL